MCNKKKGEFNSVKNSLLKLSDDINKLKTDVDYFKESISMILDLSTSLNDDKQNIPGLGCKNCSEILERINAKLIEDNKLLDKSEIIIKNIGDNLKQREAELITKVEEYNDIYEFNRILIEENKELYSLFNIDSETKLLNLNSYNLITKKNFKEINVEIFNSNHYFAFALLLLKYVNTMPINNKTHLSEIFEINLSGNISIYRIGKNNFRILTKNAINNILKGLEKMENHLGKVEEKFKVEGFSYNIVK